jgi:hypothetical protein
MSAALRAELDRYLGIRRAVGFKLARAELLLGDFLGYLEASARKSSRPSTPSRGRACPRTEARAGGDSGCRWCGPSPVISM